MIDIGFEETQETPSAIYVRDDELESLLALLMKEDIELIVRRRYWRHLNDPYREIFRAHRKTVDDAVKAANKGASTFWRMLGRKLLGTKPPVPTAVFHLTRIFTVPPYSATEVQRENMNVLLIMLLRSEKPDQLEIAELYRELENYDETLKVIEKIDGTEHTASRLIR